MLKQKVSDSTEACTDCYKNSLLIKKYEDLIHLYKKKQVRLSGMSVSRISNGPTCNTLDLQNSEAPCTKLFDALSLLFKKRCETFFKPQFGKSCKKFLLLSISNRIGKWSKKFAFEKLKKNRGKDIGEIIEVIERKRWSMLREGLTAIKTNGGIPVLEEILSETLIKPESIQKQVQLFLESLSNQITSQDNSPAKKATKIMELQIANKKLILENQLLRESLEDASRRQAKENQKKKESLEMLAEEISEKNEEIQNLKQTIKAYEETYKGTNNVLDDDIIDLRKDVDRLESVNEKLNDDLDKLKDQMEENKNKMTLLKEKNESLEKEHYEMEKAKHSENIHCLKADKREAEFKKLMMVLDKKLKRMNFYEKSVISKELEQESKPTKETQDLKTEVILMFLSNISIPEYKLHAENLFDSEEKDFLYEHKKNWIGKMSLTQKEENIKIENLEFSEIEIKRGHLNEIFEAFDSPREERHQNSPVMKMLELEIEKNKQISKISELKEKLFHVRVIILKLLKSLELQAGIKMEVEGILRVIFDMFEYSEEERESIFTKKKRLFGII